MEYTSRESTWHHGHEYVYYNVYPQSRIRDSVHHGLVVSLPHALHVDVDGVEHHPPPALRVAQPQGGHVIHPGGTQLALVAGPVVRLIVFPCVPAHTVQHVECSFLEKQASYFEDEKWQK